MRYPESFQKLTATLRAAILLCAVASVSAVSAQAQLAGKGAVQGTVTDATGAVVPGAAVVVTSDSTGISVTTKSTSSGDYNIPTLDPGTYTVTITASGFQKLVQKEVHVNALESQTFDPKLTVGGEDQVITVDSAPPQLETTNATLSTTLEQELYSELPIEMNAYGQADQRRATDFVFLTPGVNANNTTGNPTTNTGVVNGSGSRGGVSAVYIDGVPFVRAGGNGDPRFVWTALSVDAIDQLQVQTVGASAIYEGQGIQNYSVKTGGNRYHGRIYEFFRNTALDSYGFFPTIDPISGARKKPIEHSNEYGINLSGPLLPWMRDKLFFFGNYNGYRYSAQTPQLLSVPTLAQRSGNFQGVSTSGIYDPNTQAACTANSTNGPCRYRYGYGPGATTGPAGNPVLVNAAGIDVIPSSQFSPIAVRMQSYLPSPTQAGNTNNYLSPNGTALSNWSTTDRIDFAMSPKNTITAVVAIGRQASSVPVGQTTAGRFTGPVPYNYGQAYAPKTAVGIIEDTYTFTSHLVNQLKYGYARYDGPTINADQLPTYSASSLGLNGLPAGQVAEAFPYVTFAGTNAPTMWGGITANRVIAQNYTLLDTVQWTFGKHSLSIGGQIAWLLYDQTTATGGSSPLRIDNAVTETAAITPSSNTAPKYAATSGTGVSYASFLIGQWDKASFTQNLVQEYGARFRAISPYIQDNWKVTPRLTLDIGLRWDYFPPYRENQGYMSFFDPNLTNPVTGLKGALNYTGAGANTCNCDTPVQTYKKNFGPRIGLAYQIDDKTVLRASYGIMFTHGNGVGGGTASQTGTGTLGFSAAPTYSANGQLLATFNPGTANSYTIPSYQPACGRNSGPAYGTGYTTTTSYTQPGCSTASYTGTPSSGMGYADPYLGGRAPEFINWSLGLQHQWSQSFVTTMTYVGSQGHFLQSDGSNARGYWSNSLDPKYLSLGTNLASSGTTLTNYCAANSGVCPSYTNIFNTSQSLSTLLKPFPFQGLSDTFNNVSNANYHALQIVASMRAAHGLTFNANYVWSRAIDNGGTFRTGYAIPAAYSQTGKDWAPGRIERTVSTSNQPHHVNLTAVWDMPFGKSILNSNLVERAIFGGFKFSTIFQAYSGSPLPITASNCGSNPAQSTCMPTLNPNYAPDGRARLFNKHWGEGVTQATAGTRSYIDSSAFIATPAYVFGNSARTAPYSLTGPGNYSLDIGVNRTFRMLESARLNIRAELYNVTNHTQFAVSNLAFTGGTAAFGTVGPGALKSRSAQLAAKIEF